jgi:glycosyltransferase involved in cell wall biosynthesis
VNPLLSVIICTYNRSYLLKKALDSLTTQTLDKQKYEVLIIDNNSNDDTQEVLTPYLKSNDNFSVFIEYNQGLSHARNRGWKESRGEYVAYIDDDAIALNNWCEKVLDAFLNVNPKPVAVGGRILPYYEEEKPKWFLDEFEIRQWGTEPSFLQPPRAQYGFSGSNMSFQKSILEEYGGFSTKFGMIGGKLRMGEDTEFFLRLYPELPFFWYDPDIVVNHYTPKRNFSFLYKFKRSYNSAIVIHLMNHANNYEKKVVIFSLIREFKQTIKFSIKKISSLIKKIFSFHSIYKKEHFKTSCFNVMDDLGWRIGMLSASFILYKTRCRSGEQPQNEK